MKTWKDPGAPGGWTGAVAPNITSVAGLSIPVYPFAFSNIYWNVKFMNYLNILIIHVSAKYQILHDNDIGNKYFKGAWPAVLLVIAVELHVVIY